MPIYLSPGVYIEEKDLSAIIPAVSSSVAVVVGESRRGLVNIRGIEAAPGAIVENGSPQLVTSVQELIRKFGSPRLSDFAIYSALAYLKWGTRLYFIRTVGEVAKLAQRYIASADEVDYIDPTEGADTYIGEIDPSDWTANELFRVFANGHGEWGSNIGIKIVAKYKQVMYANGGSTAFETILLNKSVGKRSVYVSLRDSDGVLLSEGKDDGTVPNGAITNFRTTTNPVRGTINYDTGVVELTFTSAPENGSEVLITYSDSTLRFVLEVYDKIDGVNYSKVETWDVSAIEGAKDERGISLLLEDKVNGNSDYIWVVINPAEVGTGYPLHSSDILNLVGGTDGASVGAKELSAGWEIVGEVVDSVDVNILIQGGQTGDNEADTTVASKMIEVAESRKDCIAVLDVPWDEATASKWVQDMVDWRCKDLNANTSYGALYGDWVQVFDRWNGAKVWLPSSGFVAGVYARTDRETWPWFAPAGFNRGILNVLKVKIAFNQGMRDLMQTYNINPIQVFYGEGILVYGQKTLLGKDSALRDVNVRRLLIVIEKAMAKYARYVLFEPNDEFTRRQIKSALEEYLDIITANRGLYDYKVVCDERNNPGEVIDRNELVVDVFLKPMIAAEIIRLVINVTKTSAVFEELIVSAM